MYTSQPTTAAPLQGLLNDQVGPSFQELRPGKAARTATFPAYPDLPGLLAQRHRAHPDPAVAQVLATCAGYAYSDVGTVAMMMTRLGLENSLCRQITRSVDAMLVNSTAHVVQSRDGRVVVVAFRGTPPLDLVSWFLDADVYPERVAAAGAKAGGRPQAVHAGFYRNVRVTRHEVVHALLRALRGESVLGDPTDPSLPRVATVDGAGGSAAALRPLEALYVTGHSLGGAMAALFAAMLARSDDPGYCRIADRLEAVYTFGQPMIGDAGFAESAARDLDAAEVPVLRYVYGRDPVPRLPPGSLGPFAHFGQELHCAPDGTWTARPPSTQMNGLVGPLVTSVASFGLTRFSSLRNVPFPYKIEDHFPHHYVSALIPEGHIDEFGDYYAERRPPR